MAKDTMAKDTLPLHVDDELRCDFEDSYTEWRERNPDGDMIDWLKGLVIKVLVCRLRNRLRDVASVDGLLELIHRGELGWRPKAARQFTKPSQTTEVEMETVTLQQRLQQAVHNELRMDLDVWYAEWRERNPDGNIIDWLMELPDFMQWATGDTNSAKWLAWVAFWDWFPLQCTLLVAEATQRKERLKC